MKNLLSIIVISISTIGMSYGQTTKEILTSTTEIILKSRLNNPRSYERVDVEFIEFKRIESFKYDLNLINDDIESAETKIKNNIEVINQLKTRSYFCDSQIKSLILMDSIKFYNTNYKNIELKIKQKNSILMDSFKFYDTEQKNIEFKIKQKIKIKKIKRICLGSAIVVTSLTGVVGGYWILTLPLGVVTTLTSRNQPESQLVQKMRLESYGLIYKKLNFEQEIKENNTKISNLEKENNTKISNLEKENNTKISNLEYKILDLKNEIKENNTKLLILEYNVSSVNLELKDLKLKKDLLEYRINRTNKNEVECYIVKITFRATNKYGGITKESYEQWFPSSKPINSSPYFCDQEGIFTSDYYCDKSSIMENFGYTYSKYNYLRYHNDL